MQVWNVLHGARCKYRTQKVVKKSPFGHHRTTLSGYIFANKTRIDNGKNVLSSIISCTRSHNMVNFGPLAANIGPVVWATPANFNGFRGFAAWLHGTLRRWQRASPIFGRAAITSGIGGYASLLCIRDVKVDFFCNRSSWRDSRLLTDHRLARHTSITLVRDVQLPMCLDGRARVAFQACPPHSPRRLSPGGHIKIFRITWYNRYATVVVFWVSWWLHACCWRPLWWEGGLPPLVIAAWSGVDHLRGD